jgi:hypothetical protein
MFSACRIADGRIAENLSKSSATVNIAEHMLPIVEYRHEFMKIAQSRRKHFHQNRIENFSLND